MGPLSMEQVLAEEARRACRAGATALRRGFAPSTRDARSRSAHALTRTRTPRDRQKMRVPEEAERRKKFYRSLNQLNRSALCLSGGGIRSATFCLPA